MTGIAGATVGSQDGWFWSRPEFQAGKATGKAEGYDTLSEAVGASAEIEGAEVISSREGKYYLNEIRGTSYSKESQAEITIHANELVRGPDGQDYAVVGFMDDYNNFITQYDGDQNLEMMGQAADVQKILDMVGEDLGFKDRMTILGAASGISSPRLMSNIERLTAAIQRMPEHLPAELKEKFAEMVKPENLAMLAGVLAVWAGSHAVGVGQAADAALLVGGLAFLGVEAMDVAKNLYDFATVAVNAETEADLDSAARSLADGIATTMIGGASAAAGLGASRLASKLPALTHTPDAPPHSVDSPELPPGVSHADEIPELKSRAEYERYLNSRVYGMEKPEGVVNTELKGVIDRMYRTNSEIGSGSTADALRFELETGVPVGGVKDHLQKAEENLAKLKAFVSNPKHSQDNKIVSSQDYQVALNLIKDLEHALTTPPLPREEVINRLVQYLNDFPNGNPNTRADAIKRLAELHRIHLPAGQTP